MLLPLMAQMPAMATRPNVSHPDEDETTFLTFRLNHQKKKFSGTPTVDNHA